MDVCAEKGDEINNVDRFQVTKSHGSEAAFEILAKRRREFFDVAFWGNLDDCDVALSVRATAYALMVYTERGEHMTEPIVRLALSYFSILFDRCTYLGPCYHGVIIPLWYNVQILFLKMFGTN